MAAWTTQCPISKVVNCSSPVAVAHRGSDGVSSLPPAAVATVGSRAAAAVVLCAPLRPSGRPRRPLWWSFGTEGTISSHILLRPCLLARRKSDGGKASQDNEEEELDEDLRVGLNEISTEALKVMLSEDDRLVAALREKVDSLGEYLGQEGQLDAARFMFIVKGLLDHEVYTQKDELKGAYKKAFDKIATMIEDSGWLLKQHGDDVGGVETVDDELIPPVLNTRQR